MSRSTIKITFNQDLNTGQELSFKRIYTDYETPIILINEYTWVPIRLNYFQVTKGTPTANAGERSAINFVLAFNLDFAGHGFIVTRNVNEVTITAGIPEMYFIADFVIPGVSFETVNGNLMPFNIVSASFSQSSNPCTHVLFTVTTTDLAIDIYEPIIINSNTENPLSFEVLRGQNLELELHNADGEQLHPVLLVPGLLNAANFNLQINNSPNGATVMVLNTGSLGFGIIIEYSLDNINWQTSNTFSGLAVDDYTLYVRDNFGCSFNIAFNIDEFGIQTPYFYISKSNSIRYANRIIWGDSENYKSDENTLSCEVDVPLAYKEFQQFQSADIITTQFKSNYASNIASIIKENGSIVNVPVTKKTNNIGIKDKRDAIKYNLGSGKTGIYFLSGNIYNYTTNIQTGTFALNGLLPEWAKIGNYFDISGVWYLIEDIIFDEIKNADVIVVTNIYTGVDVNVIVGSVYNRFNYEVYEYAIDMVNYIDEKFRVKLECSNVNFTTITQLSEVVWVKVKHDNVLEIKYRNATNTDILYSTGIEHKIRVPYLKVSGKSDEQSEVHKTDTDAILLNADLYEVDDFQFEPVTKEIWRKLMIALSHEKVFINGVGYVKNGNFNTEGPLEHSNLYVLTASMIKTGSVYNSQTSGNIDFDGTEVDVPGLITTDLGGYVKY